MLQSLGSLFVELKAETGAFVAGMSKASYASKQAAKDIQQGFDKIGSAVSGAFGQFGEFGNQLSAIGNQASQLFSALGKSGSAISGIAAIGAVAIGAAAGLAALAIHGAELVERLSLISQKTGISIHDLQGFEAAGKTVGVSLEDMVTAMRKLDQGISGIGKGSAAAGTILKGLGVTSKDNKEALLQLSDAFQKMPDGAQKAADAVAVLGRSGLQLIPLLNMGRQKIQEFNEMVDEYGPKVGVAAVKANEDFLMSQAKLSLIWQSLSVTAEQTFLPALAKIVTAMADLTKATGAYFSALKSETWTDVGKFLINAATGNPLAAGLSVPMPTNSGNADAAKAAADKKNSDALQKQEDSYNRIKAGSAAVYALESKRAEIAVYVDALQWDKAAAAQKEIPALEQAVELEKERTAELQRATQEVQNYIAALFKQQLGGEKPLFSLGRPAQLKAAAAAPAPDIPGGPPQISTSTNLFGPQVDAFAESAKAKIADFYSSWGTESKKSEDDVNETYDGELKTLQGYFALGIISQQTFSDASIALEKSRAAAIQAVWKSSNTFADQFKSFFVGVGAAGQDVAKSFFADMQTALDSLNSQLAKFVVTGKGLNFRKLGQGLEENLASTGLKKVESLGANALGGLFGVKTGKKGDNAGNPLFVSPVDASGNVLGAFGGGGGLAGATGIGSLPFTPGGLANVNSLSALNGLGTARGGSIFSSIFSKLSGIFGGFLSGGGDVTPGKTYVVGEDHPEFFSPKTAGKVAPSLKFSGSTPPPIVNFVVNGVSDFDSFKRSQPQIAANLAQQLAMANARSR